MPLPTRTFCIFLTLLLGGALGVAAQAQNATGNGFQTAARGNWQEYAYTYTNAQNQPQRLSFRLNADDIALGSAEFRAWDDTAATAAAVQAVQARAKALETPTLKATVSPLRHGMSIRLTGTNLTAQSPQVKHLNEALHTTYTTSLQSYATRSYYRATLEGEHRAVIQPDHPAIARRYVAAMRPVAQAIQQQVPGASQSPRAFINAALTWLQSIPYDELENRYTSNGAGFQTPYGLINSNVGDCDTKATALAALIRAAYPSLPLAIVYVPNHAFLGVGLPQGPNDFALQTQHGTYVLADATGPGLAPLGYIDRKTQAKTGGRSTEVLPIP